MDRMINLRAARVGYVFAGIGFVGVLVTLALGLGGSSRCTCCSGPSPSARSCRARVSVYGYERGVRRA